jgi:hypothetical protein
LHEIVKTPVVAAQITSEFEPIIYHKRVIPPYVSSPSNAYLRQSASVQIAEISVVAGTTPVVTISNYTDETIASI